MSKTTTHMRDAVLCGYWSLLRYNPKTNTFSEDSRSDFDRFDAFLEGESRFSAIKELKGEEGEKLLAENKKDAMERIQTLKRLAGI